jgi:hypothetical protein
LRQHTVRFVECDQHQESFKLKVSSFKAAKSFVCFTSFTVNF